MQCPRCNAQLDDDTIFCGNCGHQVAPLQAKGATVSDKGKLDDNGYATVISDQNSQRSALQTPTTPVRNYVSPHVPPTTPSQRDTPSVSPQMPTRRTNVGRIVLLAALVLLIIAGGSIGAAVLLKNNSSPKSTTTGNTALASNAKGVVNFSDIQNGSGHSNVVSISVSGLATPPAGSQYQAWIVDTQSERSTGLGTLTHNQNGEYTASSTNKQHNVLSLGNKVEVTLEQGTVTVPTGQLILSTTFPPKAFVHIKHLLVSFPDTPGKIGLLVGLVDQTQKLSSSSQLLQSIAGSGNTVAIQCAAQSIIDIIQGTHDSHYQPLAGQCASQNITEVGDSYGLLGAGGYIANGEAHASLAATQSDTTANIRLHAGHVAICLENVKGWITTINKDALALLNNPTDTTKVQEIVRLANHALNGVDTNGDERIDPIPGEGGAITAYLHGQLMAALDLAPGSQ
jgi:hypothetical protein